VDSNGYFEWIFQREVEGSFDHQKVAGKDENKYLFDIEEWSMAFALDQVELTRFGHRAVGHLEERSVSKPH